MHQEQGKEDYWMHYCTSVGAVFLRMRYCGRGGVTRRERGYCNRLVVMDKVNFFR